MKKPAMILMLLVGILFMASCGSSKYANRASKTDIDLKEDLQALDDIRNALADLGLDVDFAENTINTLPSEDKKISGYAAYKEGFEPVPIEMFLLRENEYSNFDKYANNYYYCYGLVPEWTDSEDLYEYMDFFLMTDYNNNVEYLSVVVIGNDEQEGWSDLKEEFEVFVYFKFVGYSHELDRPVGLFEFYELL